MTGSAKDGGEKAPGREDSPVSDAEAGEAESTESGYRRDDYWREAASDDTGPTSKPEPDQGFGFESTEEKTRSGDGNPDGPGASDEQGNAGDRDKAHIVDD